MTTCYLPIAWRGVGKSTWCKKAATDLGAPIVSRDRFRMRFNGSLYFNRYEYSTEIEEYAIKHNLRKIVRRGLHAVILDSCDGYSAHRRRRIREMKEDIGIGTVIGVRLNLPPEVAYRQYIGREQSLDCGYLCSFETYLCDYNIFERETCDLENEGFDQLVHLDRTQEGLTF